MQNDEPICVATYPSEIEAETARMKLGMAGIDALIAKDDCGGMRPICKRQLAYVLWLEPKMLKPPKVFWLK